ncbi:hypothetical protein FB45DRAFT_947042 [Roridomyces roridus]|uniref:Uncharacterized protein n=1 Tax=Roridomyces roridus TaxID=1738132 RepID=A0AAD7B1Y1_9AGAR|nr:hypothetical protein FB45DRAFT_947042 [Roridomyces roridus]
MMALPKRTFTLQSFAPTGGTSVSQTLGISSVGCLEKPNRWWEDESMVTAVASRPRTTATDSRACLQGWRVTLYRDDGIVEPSPLWDVEARCSRLFRQTSACFSDAPLIGTAARPHLPVDSAVTRSPAETRDIAAIAVRTCRISALRAHRLRGGRLPMRWSDGLLRTSPPHSRKDKQRAMSDRVRAIPLHQVLRYLETKSSISQPNTRVACV